MPVKTISLFFRQPPDSESTVFTPLSTTKHTFGSKIQDHVTLLGTTTRLGRLGSKR